MPRAITRVVMSAWIGIGCTLAEDAPRTITVPVCESPPKLDADLSDASWSSAVKLTGFYRFGAQEPGLTGVQTTVWLCRDDAWFYLGFRCDEPTAIGLRRVGTVRDAASGDDAVEVFLDPGHGGKGYAHFMLTANNVQLDQWCRGNRRDRSWNLPWRSAVEVDPDLDRATGWSAEAALPLCRLHAYAGKGPWRMNVCRTRRAVAPAEHSCLAKPLPETRSFHDPSLLLPVEGLTGFSAAKVFGPTLGVVRATPMTLAGDHYSYGVETSVRNRAGLAGRVELVVVDQPRDGEPSQTVVPVDLGGREEKTVSVCVPMAAPGAREARIFLRLPDDGTVLQTTAVVDMDRLLPVDAYLDRNYYTTETEAKVHVDILLDRSAREAAKLTVTAEIERDDGRIERCQAAVAASEMALPLPLAEVKPGTYPVRVRLESAGGGELGAVTLKLDRRPPAPEGVTEVKIDRYNRCLLLNGKPFFPLGGVGAWCPGPIEGVTEEFYRADLARCRDAGFNVNMDWRWYGKYEKPIENRKIMYDLVREYGMFVILGKPYDGANVEKRKLSYRNPEFVAEALKVVENMTPTLELSRSHPAVIGYYHFDEPQPKLNIDQALSAFYDKVRTMDPYHPVYMSLTRYVHESQTTFPGRFTDLLGAHNYWYVMNQPSDLARMSGYWDVLDRYSRKQHLPTMTVPQLDLWGSGYSGGAFMTPAEQKAQTYVALVHGARSVIYFVLPWRHRLSVAAQKELSAEVQALAPALLTREPDQEVSWTPQNACFTFGLAAVARHGKMEDPKYPLVRVSLRTDPRGGQVLLAVNPNRQTAAVRLRLSRLGPQAAVASAFNEATRFPVTDGAFEDTIEPMGTRAYRIQGVTLPKDEPVRIHLDVSGPAVDAIGRVPERPALGKNRVRNSSFERARMEGWPDHWFPNATWIDIPPSPRASGLDGTNPFHGKQCLRVVRDARFSTYIISTGLDAPPGKPYTASAWMRSEKPDYKVRLYWGGGHGEFVLTDQWKRYAFTVTEPKKGRYIQIWPWARGDNVFYLDAVQLEQGVEATEYEGDEE